MAGSLEIKSSACKSADVKPKRLDLVVALSIKMSQIKTTVCIRRNEALKSDVVPVGKNKGV